MSNELIILKQQAVIEESLKEKGLEVQARLQGLENLIVTEQSRKESKSLRAELTKEATEIHNNFKTVIAELEKPIKEIKTAFKEHIEQPYKLIDGKLKNQIEEIETGLKQQKQEEAQAYFVEYKQSINDLGQLDFISWNNMSIKIGLNDTLASLRKQIKAFIDEKQQEVSAILNMHDGIEILAEYKESLNFTQAVQIVSARKERLLKAEQEKARIEEEKLRRAEELKTQQELQPVVEPIVAPIQEALSVPVVEEKQEETPILKEMAMKFEVTGTIEQLKTVKAFLIENNIKFRGI